MLQSITKLSIAESPKQFLQSNLVADKWQVDQIYPSEARNETNQKWSKLMLTALQPEEKSQFDILPEDRNVLQIYLGEVVTLLLLMTRLLQYGGTVRAIRLRWTLNGSSTERPFKAVGIVQMNDSIGVQGILHNKHLIEASLAGLRILRHVADQPPLHGGGFYMALKDLIPYRPLDVNELSLYQLYEEGNSCTVNNWVSNDEPLDISCRMDDPDVRKQIQVGRIDGKKITMAKIILAFLKFAGAPNRIEMHWRYKPQRMSPQYSVFGNGVITFHSEQNAKRAFDMYSSIRQELGGHVAISLPPPLPFHVAKEELEDNNVDLSQQSLDKMHHLSEAPSEIDVPMDMPCAALFPAHSNPSSILVTSSTSLGETHGFVFRSSVPYEEISSVLQKEDEEDERRFPKAWVKLYHISASMSMDKIISEVTRILEKAPSEITILWVNQCSAMDKQKECGNEQVIEGEGIMFFETKKDREEAMAHAKELQEFTGIQAL